jgi:gas vesicle protein
MTDHVKRGATMANESSADKMAYMMWGMMVGAGLGVVAGRLTATKSGEDMMREMRTRGKDAHDKVEQRVKEGSDKVTEKVAHAADEVKTRAATRARRAVDKAEAEVDGPHSESSQP